MTKVKNPANKTAKVIQFPAGQKTAKRKPADKWSSPVMALGFCTIPSLLLWAQKRLGLSSEEFNIVMQLADMWWDATEWPYPKKETLAGRMNMSSRQIQRHLKRLEKKGLIKRISRFRGPKDQTSNMFSLEGLVDKLKKLEPEFRKVKDQNRIRQKKVETQVS